MRRRGLLLLLALLVALSPYISREPQHDLLVILNEQGQGTPDELRLLAEATQEPVIAQIQNTGAVVEDSFWLINGLHIKATEGQLKEIKKISSISQITPNRIFYPLRNQSMPLIGATAAQASGWNGTGVTIAILDTGVNFSKPELGDARKINETDIVTGDWDGNNATDFWGHGTDMALIAAGSGGNNYGIGVAPNASIDNVKVFSCTSGCGNQSQVWSATEADVISGLQWVMALTNRPSVILLSFGAYYDGTCSGPLITTLDTVVSSGTTVISAIGNRGPCAGPTNLEYAGCSKKVIAVGATIDGGPGGHSQSYSDCAYGTSYENDTDALFGLSSRGPTVNSRIKPDITAPGYYIETGSGYPYNLTAYSSSLGAAHVAGAVALMQQKMRATESRNLTTAQVKAILMNSAKDLGAAGRDNLYGAGRLNITEALKESNSSYFKACTRWRTDNIPTTFKFYHEINVSAGVSEVWATVYWEENNATDHANIALKLADPDFILTESSDPAADIARQIKKSTSKSGTWYAILGTDRVPANDYTIVSNYPIGSCQISDVTNMALTLYNNSDFSVQNQTSAFWPSYSFDQYKDITRHASYIYYKITQQDRFGLQTNNLIDVKLNRDGAVSTIFNDTAPNSGDGLFLSNNTPGASIFIDTKAAGSCSSEEIVAQTCRSSSSHYWILEARISKKLGGVLVNSATYTVNKTYGVAMNLTALNATARYGQPATVNLTLNNTGNVGDLYAIAYQMSRIQGSSTSRAFTGACTAAPAASALLDWNQTNASTFQIGIPSDATGGDGCYMYLNATSEKAYSQADQLIIDDGNSTDINSFTSNCDGLHIDALTRNFSYFTYTPAQNIMVKETCIGWSKYSGGARTRQDEVRNFKLYFAQDADRNFVPDTGQYALAFEVVNTTDIQASPIVYPPSKQDSTSYISCFPHTEKYYLEGGKTYSFKVESFDPDMFEFLTIEKGLEKGVGACTQNVVSYTDPAPSGCSCDTGAPGIGSSGSGTAMIRFYGTKVTYGFNESGVEVYATDNTTLTLSKPIPAEYTREQVAPVEVNTTNHLTDFIIGMSFNVTAADALGRPVNPPLLAQSGESYISSYQIPKTTLSGNTSAVGNWTLMVNASRPYFSAASRNISFTVRGRSNISIDTGAAVFYRGQAASLLSTVKNEFGDIENPASYTVSWRLNSSNISQSEDAIYTFAQEIGPYNLSASVNGTYLNYSQDSKAVEIWDVLNASLTVPSIPSLGSPIEIQVNTTRAYNEQVTEGINVTCTLPNATNNTGISMNATLSGGLWRCPYSLNKDSDPRGNWRANITLSGRYYNTSNQSSSFWVRGSDVNITVIASNYSIETGDTAILNANFTNIGDSTTASLTLALEYPPEVTVSSGQTPQWPSQLDPDNTTSKAWGITSASIPGNYTINVTADMTNGPRRAKQVTIQVNEALRMLMLTGTPISALAGRNTTLAFNMTYNTNPLNDTGNFTAQNISVYIGGAPAVLLNLSHMGNGTWNLTFANPVLEDGLVYNLTVNASYRGAKRTLIQPGGMNYYTTPAFNITIAPIGQVNSSQAFNITANVTNVGKAGAAPANITIYLPPQLSISGAPALQQYTMSANASRLVVWNVTGEIGMQYTVFVNASAENATTASANVTFELISIPSVRIIAPNSSAQANISSNDSFNSIVNTSYNGTALNGTMLSISNFSAWIGASDANITAASYLAGIWNLTVKAGSISENSDYALNITVRYGGYNATGTSLSAVRGRETPPNITAFATSPSRIWVNSSAMLIVTVIDNSEVANVTGNLTYPNSSSIAFDFSKNMDNYTYTFTPTEIGLYNLTITANDTFGIMAVFSATLASNGPPAIQSVLLLPSRYLASGEAVTFLVNASSGLGVKNVTVNITNTAGGTVSRVANATASGYNTTYNNTTPGAYSYTLLVEDNYNNTNARSGAFYIRDAVSANITVPAGTNAALLLEGDRAFNATGAVLKGNYSLRLSNGSLALEFFNLTIAANLLGFVNFTGFNSTNTTRFSLHRGYEITSNISFQSVNITIGFNASAVNSSRLAVYRCGNLTGASCIAGWAGLPSSTDDTANRTSAVSGTLSAYALGESHTFSLGIISASPASDIRSGNVITVNASLLYDSSALQNASFSADIDGAPAAVSAANTSGGSWTVDVTAPSLSGGSRTLRVYAAYGDWQVNSTVPVSYYTAPSTPPSSDGGGGGGGGVSLPSSPAKSAKISDYPRSMTLAPGDSGNAGITVNNTGKVKINASLSATLAWAKPGPAKEISAGKAGVLDLNYAIPASAAEGSYSYKIQVFDSGKLLASEDAALVVKKEEIIQPPPAVIQPIENLTGSIDAQKAEAAKLSITLNELKQKGFDASAGIQNLDYANMQLEQAARLAGTGALSDANVRIEDAKATISNVDSSVKNSLDDEYSTVKKSAESQNNTRALELLGNARASIDNKEYPKAADYLKEAKQQLAIQPPPPVEPSNLPIAIALILVLAALGSLIYYKKDAIAAMVPRKKQAMEGMKIKAIYVHEKYNALLGRDVLLSGTVAETVDRKNGWWLVVRDDSGETLVWSPKALRIGDNVTVSGKVHIDDISKSIYIDGREIVQESGIKGIEESRVETEKPALYWLGLELSNALKGGSLKDRLMLLGAKLELALGRVKNALARLPLKIKEKIREIRTRPKKG